MSAIKNPYTLPNPKDVLAGDKVPLHVVPESMEVLASLGMFEGSCKYGQFNYRARPVRLSVYVSALKRHSKRLNEGEWSDQKTNVPHISSILACAAIIGDAWLNGTLIDDRPPANKGTLEFMDNMPAAMDHLRHTFKDYSPTQYTQAVLEAEVAASTKPKRKSKKRK